MTDNKKFNKKLNYDVATEGKIKSTNEELVQYMKDSGEGIAAEQIQYLIDKKKETDKQIPVKNPINDKLLNINNGILATLKNIQEDLIDEQDTSIRSISSVQSKVNFPNKEKTKVLTAAQDPVGLGGLISDLLGGILAGLGIVGGLKSLKGLLDKSSKIDKRLSDDKKDREKSRKERDKSRQQRNKARSERIDAKSQRDTAKQQRVSAKAERAEANKQRATARQQRADFDKKPKKPNAASTKTPIPSKFTKLLKFGKAIPILGTALAAGFALYAANDGWDNAGSYLGIPNSKVTDKERLAAAAGAIVDDFTFGLVPIDKTANMILSATRDAKTTRAIKYYEGLGVIDHNTVLKSEITDWGRVKNLTPTKIQEIIDINDWAAEDLSRLEEAKKSAERRKVEDAAKYDAMSEADQVKYKVLKGQELNADEQKIKVQNEIIAAKQTIKSFDNTISTLASMKQQKISEGKAKLSDPPSEAMLTIIRQRAEILLRLKRLEIEATTLGVEKLPAIKVDTSQSKTTEEGHQITSSEPLKEHKETIVYQTNQTLTNQTKAYDNGIAASAAQFAVNATTINSKNIIKTDEQVNHRLLNMFHK